VARPDMHDHSLRLGRVPALQGIIRAEAGETLLMGITPEPV